MTTQTPKTMIVSLGGQTDIGEIVRVGQTKRGYLYDGYVYAGDKKVLVIRETNLTRALSSVKYAYLERSDVK